MNTNNSRPTIDDLIAVGATDDDLQFLRENARAIIGFATTFTLALHDPDEVATNSSVRDSYIIALSTMANHPHSFLAQLIDHLSALHEQHPEVFRKFFTEQKDVASIALQLLEQDNQ